MTARIVVAVALLVVLAGIAWWLERRRPTDAPSQGAPVAPLQLDRHDFPAPDASWLVVLFTSKTCESCAGLYDKAAPLAGDDVAVVEVEYPAQRALHDRYHVTAAPMTLVADHDGVVRATFLGAFGAPELWTAVAELRSER
jgi:hypothetical protein